jgi:hypothetical protein
MEPNPKLNISVRFFPFGSFQSQEVVCIVPATPKEEHPKEAILLPPTTAATQVVNSEPAQVIEF